jgi:hypothetical protein
MKFGKFKYMHVVEFVVLQAINLYSLLLSYKQFSYHLSLLIKDIKDYYYVQKLLM